MTLNLKFTPQDWERIKRDWTAWWNHDLDRPMVVVDDVDWQGKGFVPQFDGWDLKKNIYPTDSALDYYQSILETCKLLWQFLAALVAQFWRWDHCRVPRGHCWGR